MEKVIVEKEFFVVQYGVRALKYLGSNCERWYLTNDFLQAGKFRSFDYASRHTDCLKNKIGKVVKVKAIYEVDIEE